MHKKQVIGAAIGASVLFSVIMPGMAAWAPSKTQQEILSARASATIGGITKPVMTVVGGGEVPEGYPVTASGNLILSQVTDPLILVTPLSQTQLGNQGVGEGLAYGDKAGLETESGLTYAANAKTNLVYQTIVNAKNTTEFLSKFPGNVKRDVEELIARNIQAEREELEREKADAEANGDEKTVASVEKQLAALEEPSRTSVNSYSPLAVFDVSASSALLEQMGEGDTVDLTLELNGVNQDSDLIALHFMGDPEDCDATRDLVNSDFAHAVVDFDVEVLEVTVEEKAATFTLSSFSPVVLMTRVESNAEEAPNQTEKPVHEESQGTDKGSWMAWTIGGAVGAGILVTAVMAGKKKTSEKK